MSPLSARKFTLVDAMVLIAAIAIALVLIRPFWKEVYFTPMRSPREAILFGLSVEVILEPLALTLSLAVGLLRLRKPRPRLRRVFRQPGMAACMAAFSVAIITVLIYNIFYMMIFSSLRIAQSGHLFSFFPDGEFWFVMFSFTGWAVAAVWTTLWLAGNCRAEPGWIDRTGRALGIYWVLNRLVCVPALS